MASLNTYLMQTQRFLREGGQKLVKVDNLIEYINRGRREVAERAQCVRRLTPISGTIMDAPLISGGANYSAQTVISITPPDFPSGMPPYPDGLQATAELIIRAGVVTAANIQNGGSGYFQPQATIVDPTGAGSGAAVALTVSPINTLIPNQEFYPFSSIDVSMFPGVDSVYMIKSVSVIYANYRYSLPQYSFSVYQAMIRQYPFSFTYVPTFFTQYGQGNAGSLFMYPWPSQIYQIEFDCFAVPSDLSTDNDVDVIPQPWSDTVPYFAAHLAYLEMQNFNAGKYYLDLFDNMLLRKSTYARPGRMTNPYGRW